MAVSADLAPQTRPAIAIRGVTKVYPSGFQALHGIDLEIAPGEIFALLGPNGAGKTTLISIVCGIVTPTTGTILANGHDILRDYRGGAQRHRPRAAGTGDGCVRDRDGHGQLQPRPVRQTATIPALID